MRVQPIVEGHGDVIAVPILLRRLIAEAQLSGVEVGRPIRRKLSELHTRDGVLRAVRLALIQPDCSAILLLFDSEDSCPRELAPKILAWAQEAAGRTPCAVVLPFREYETWFLAAIESLRGKRGIRADAALLGSFEERRGAKEALKEYMPKSLSYHETIDQPALTAAFDMSLAYRRSRSFRKMVNSICQLARALGTICEPWPPANWTQ